MLTERQLEIILALVYEYIQTGEPVGSRTLSKKYLTDHSPATVRNEMSDLEELGYFSKPHSSAGRLPTSRAYRLYVDAILHRPAPQMSDMGELVSGLDLQLKGLDERLGEVSRFLSRLTRCLSVAAVRVLDDLRVHKVDFVRVSSVSTLVILVFDSGRVRHARLPMPAELTDEALDDLAGALNHQLRGRTWREARRTLGEFLTHWSVPERTAMDDTLDRLEEIMDRERLTVSAGGAVQVLQAAEDGRLEQPQGLLRLLEEGDAVESLITDYAAPEGIRVTIGAENRADAMKDCSVVMASSSSRGRQAVLGLIGPLRMNYQRSIAILDAVLSALNPAGDDGR